MNLQKTRQQYNSLKRIFEILESGDIKDERYKLLISSLHIEDVERMREFIKYCEDVGVQYINEIN